MTPPPLAPMRRFLRRQRLRLEDGLRNAPLSRAVLSRYRAACAPAPRQPGGAPAAARIRSLCAAARLADSRRRESRLIERIRADVARLAVSGIDGADFYPDASRRHVARAVILKPYDGNGEKGVVFISFEREWIKLLHRFDLAEFARRYDLVIAPSSSPHNPACYLLPAVFPGPVFTLISNAEDLDVLPRVAPNYVVLPLYASSWIDPASFQPLPPEQRDIDLLMVANFGKVKRHQALFGALREIRAKHRQLNVVLVGQEQDGRTADSIRSEAAAFGVADRLAIHNDLPHDAVARLFCRAKTSAVLSRREGACVAVAESLFADTPVALLAGARIGSRAFINSSTGRLLDDRHLGFQLLDFIDHARDYAPRAWALDHITCHRSTEILNDALRRHARELFRPWTRDIAPLCWRPDPSLLRPEDRIWHADEARRIRDRFGLLIGPEAPAPVPSTEPSHSVASPAKDLKPDRIPRSHAP